MEWDKPAPTLTTQFYRYGTGRYGHPEQHRALSLREGAILQTFPANYEFVPPNETVNFTSIGRHIGNAVPPALGYIIGKSILKHVGKSMANSNVYTLEIDLNVLNHLGLNLYSNVPAVLSELIANAWDADANNVEITISKHSEGIVITDDGSGMNIKDLNGKFLTVGYPRRTESTNDRTSINDRLVMGRKGIGKLSVFSIAEHIQVITKTVDDSQVGLELTLEGISEAIDSKNPYHPTPMDVFPNDISIDTSGTVIILKKLKKRIYASLGENLRKRVARRFDVIGNEFQVKIDGDTVAPGFRDYSNLLDYALIYGTCEQFGFGCKVDKQSNMVKVANHEYPVTGWIGLIKESGLLQEQGGDNLNKISVLARGKMALEDILQSYREGGLYTKYVIGQIRADFLDESGDEDIATSSRQDFVQNDSRFIAFREFVHKEIKKSARSAKKSRTKKERQKQGRYLLLTIGMKASQVIPKKQPETCLAVSIK